MMPYGFRILGATNERRRLVNHADAFAAYAACDDRADVTREAYLSAFTFGDDFRGRLESTGSVKGFDGVCGAPWLWFDIDRVELADAVTDARRLALSLVERYRLDDDALLTFFSGSKGFHLGLPTSLWAPTPSTTFNRQCRMMAGRLASTAGVAIDVGVYDMVRAFRAPNSRHPKTGLHKRRLALDELQGLSLDAIRKLAETPEPFDLPTMPPANAVVIADWQADAVMQREREASDSAFNRVPTLNRTTEEFIRDGVGVGDRHRVLFSAAANLAEFDCPLSLAAALLSGPARDSGLSAADIKRQIELGFQHGKRD